MTCGDLKCKDLVSGLTLSVRSVVKQCPGPVEKLSVEVTLMDPLLPSVPKLQSCLGVGVENSDPQKDDESGKFGDKCGMN